MLRKFMVKTAVVTAMSLAAISSASAQSMAGSVSFTGVVDLFNDPADPTNNTLYVDFLGAPVGRGDMFTSPGSATGVFANPFVNVASVSDLRVTPGATTVVSTPFLTYGNYIFQNPVFAMANPAFYTSTYGSIGLRQTSLPNGQTNVSAEVNLTGTLVCNGNAACATGPQSLMPGQQFSGVFTTQFAGYTIERLLTEINSPTGITNKGISADFSYNAIPEPSTYALMGAGLAALGLIARRRRTNV